MEWVLYIPLFDSFEYKVKGRQAYVADDEDANEASQPLKVAIEFNRCLGFGVNLYLDASDDETSRKEKYVHHLLAKDHSGIQKIENNVIFGPAWFLAKEFLLMDPYTNRTPQLYDHRYHCDLNNCPRLAHQTWKQFVSECNKDYCQVSQSVKREDWHDDLVFWECPLALGCQYYVCLCHFINYNFIRRH